MIKLKKSTTLALYAIVELSHEKGRLLSAGQIADRYQESEHHVAKVLQQLAQRGLVESIRGVGGGFRIARDPRDITMLDVVALFEPASRLEEASHDDGSSKDAPLGAWRVAEVLAELDEQAYYTLKSVSIATLLHHGRLL